MADIDNSNLPYNLEAEQSVLGAILLDSSTMNIIADRLKPQYFYIDLHKEIFTVILQMFMSGNRIDIVTVLDNCNRFNIFDNQTDAKVYLAKLMEITPSVNSAANYCSIVEEKYLVRSLILTSKEIIEMATTGSDTATALLDFAEQKIYDIRSDKDVKGLTHISKILVDKIQEIYKASEAGGDEAMGTLKTNYNMLDHYITGLNPSDLLLIAARPGMGKTSFAMNVVINVAKKYPQKKIAVFSLEMSKEQLVGRVLSSETGIDSQKLRTGKLDHKSDWRKIGESADILSKLGIYIDDTAAITVGQMKAKLRRLKNLGVVVIDYLQLMNSGRKIDNRVNEVSEITRSLKVMAKELAVPVITLSQLSRGPEGRQDKRPMLSDLRESGSIEQDADIVMFLFREGYYDKTVEHQANCECIVAKNRHGETGTIELIWDGKHTKFADPERDRVE